MLNRKQIILIDLTIDIIQIGLLVMKLNNLVDVSWVLVFMPLMIDAFITITYVIVLKRRQQEYDNYYEEDEYEMSEITFDEEE